MAASPAAVSCSRSMPGSAPCRWISCRWNPHCVPTSARRAIAMPARWSGSLACRAPENPRWPARWSAGCSARAARQYCSMATRCAPASTATSAFPRRTAPLLAHIEIMAFVAAVPPGAKARAAPRRIAETAFREIYVATPAEVCESRDPKGHYAKARAGGLNNFTGIGKDYQAPTGSELTIDTSARSVSEATDEIERMLAKTGVLFDELVDLAANI